MSIESKKVVIYTKDETKHQAFDNVLKKLELIDNFYPKTVEECIDIFKQDKNILILDLAVGMPDCVKLMMFLTDNFYIATKKSIVLVYGAESPGGFLVEYDITHSCFGEFSEESIENSLKEIVESSVIDQEISLELADILFSSTGSDQDKIIRMEEMYKKYTFNPNVCFSLATLYMRVGGYSKVPSLLQSLIVHEYQSIRELSLIGLALYKEGKHQDALENLKKAHEYNPYNITRLEALAGIYLDSQAYDQAAPIYKILKELDPQNQVLISGEGRIRLVTEDVNEVCSVLEKKLSPENMVSMINEVAIYLVKPETLEKNEARILSLYYRACRYCLNNKEQLSRVCFNLALAYYKLDDIAKAHYFFTLASLLDSSYGKAISNAALLKMKLKPDQIIPVEGGDLGKSIFKFAS